MTPYPKPAVVGIYVAATRGAPMEARAHVRVFAGRGIEGDRFCATEAEAAHKARLVTLIEEEAVLAAQREMGVAFGPEHTRRNILVRGVALNHLVGRWFRVGAVLFEGKELCEPCGHLAKLTSSDFKKALIHRGGLRAWVREGGAISAGDRVDVTGPVAGGPAP